MLKHNQTYKTYLVRLPVCSRANLLPCRGSTSEVPICLSHLQGLHHNSLLLFVVSDLGISGHWEVFSQWVPVEAVICHYPPQIGMAGEEDAKQIIHFSLVPIGSIIKPAERGYWRGFIGICLHAYARIVANGKKIVDDLEALVLSRIIYSGDVRNLRVFGSCVILEEGEDRNDT